MVRSGDDGHKNKEWVSNSNEHVNSFRDPRFLHLTLLELAWEYGRVVNHGATNDESVTEMHTRHGCKSVDELAAHPDATCIRVVNRIKEAVIRR